MLVRRFAANPIIRPHMDGRMGSNINGPSLIRAPYWLDSPLGRYYLYFGDHRGTYIRLAYAERLEGPWATHAPGTLQIEQTPYGGHIASPDVHVDDERREIRMYYHGALEGRQASSVAVSRDGIHFTSRTEILDPVYLRALRWGGYWYGLGMPGIFYRSRDGLTRFERGPQFFTPDMRHAALRLSGDTLSIFYTNAHDCPERILLSSVRLTLDWRDWVPTPPVTMLEPDLDYEGGNLPLVPSQRGPINERVRQLRDPAIFAEGGKTYLLYAVAGEAGIAIAQVLE